MMSEALMSDLTPLAQVGFRSLSGRSLRKGQVGVQHDLESLGWQLFSSALKVRQVDRPDQGQCVGLGTTQGELTASSSKVLTVSRTPLL